MSTTTYTCADARCVKCGAHLTGASDPYGPAAPVPDDLSVCAYCGALLVFNHDMTLREANREDLATLTPETAWKLGMIRGAIHLRLKQEKERNGTH